LLCEKKVEVSERIEEDGQEAVEESVRVDIRVLLGTFSYPLATSGPRNLVLAKGGRGV